MSAAAAAAANPEELSREAAKQCSVRREARFLALQKKGRGEHPCIYCGEPDRWMCDTCEWVVCCLCRKEKSVCLCESTLPTPSSSPATRSSKAPEASQG